MPSSNKQDKYNTRSRNGVKVKGKQTKEKKTKETQYTRHESSDDDDDWVTDPDEEFDKEEYQKLLAKLFPSKYSKKKAQLKTVINKKKKSLSSGNNSKTKNENPNSDKVAKQKKSKQSKRNRYRREDKSESEEETVSEKEMYSTTDSDYEESDSQCDSSDYDSEDSYIDSEEEEALEELLGDSRKSNFNIVFTIGGRDYQNEYSDEYSDDSQTDSDYVEDEHTDHNETSESDDETIEKDKSSSLSKKQSSKSKKYDKTEDTDIVPMRDDVAIDKFKTMIGSMTPEELASPFVKQMLEDFNKRDKEFKAQEKKKTKKIRKKNTLAFQKLLREKNVMNDTNYFKNEISLDEQKMILKKMKEINEHSNITKPYRVALLDANIPIAYKACAYRKINTLKYMEPGGGEYYKIKNWVDAFMRIPFGKHKTLPLTIDDGVEKCHNFMDNAKQILDKAVYGLDDAKLQIMQFVGQWIANPSAIGSSIAIKGPMGTGKTTLVKEGISKILGREFAFIALGGATDSSFLEGHSYTYEGSTWGKIVDILLQTKTMNPVIYFDELDKLSDTPKGDELAGILTHLTDTSQNSKYHDRYFSEIDFDLSRCLFIFSYNDESKVNPILLDRMYRIQTKGYDKKEKTTIANDYLLPTICKQVNFKPGDITIPEETIQTVIETYTDGESGVRNLKRCLEIIYTKLNLYRLMKPGTNLFNKDMNLDISFPVTLKPEMVSKIIKKCDNGSSKWNHMYM